MKKIISIAILTGMSFIGMSSFASASDRHSSNHSYTEYGIVISAQPIFKQVKHREPQQECWIEHQEYISHVSRPQHSYGGNHRGHIDAGSGGLVGGIIGGVIGNQIGRHGSKRGRVGATVAGAIIGSAIAGGGSYSSSRNYGHHNGSYNRNRGSQRFAHKQYRKPKRVLTTKPVKHCRETFHTSYERRIQGYDVTYRYRGKTYHTRTKHNPGRKIALEVSVKPQRY